MCIKYTFLSGFLGVLLCTGPLQAADAAQQNLEWSVLNGSMNTRMISPSGDILDSGMDALSPLNIAPINMPYAKLTPEVFKNPQQATTAVQKAFFIPEDENQRKEITADDMVQVDANRQAVLKQIASYTLTFGLKSDHNAAEFGQRRDKAYQFIATGSNEREDQQVLNGITLGELAEMNKILGLTATQAILLSTDGWKK